MIRADHEVRRVHDGRYLCRYCGLKVDKDEVLLFWRTLGGPLWPWHARAYHARHLAGGDR